MICSPGTTCIRKGLDRGLTAAEMEAGWQEDLARFLEVRREFLLYGSEVIEGGGQGQAAPAPSLKLPPQPLHGLGGVGGSEGTKSLALPQEHIDINLSRKKKWGWLRVFIWPGSRGRPHKPLEPLASAKYALSPVI